MNYKIQQWLQAFNHPEAVRLFFSQLGLLIRELNLSADNEKLALNVRDDGKQRISVNLNSRLVLSLNQEANGVLLQYMINTEDLQALRSGYEIVREKPFGDFGKQAHQVYIPYHSIAQRDQAHLLSLWLKSCRQYEPAQKRSQYRVHNIPEVYNIAVNSQLLDSYLNGQVASGNQRYFLLGYTWTGADPQDRSQIFYSQGKWINGYETEFLDQVKAVPVGARVALKSSFTSGPNPSVPVIGIKAYGTVTANAEDGRELLVDWQPLPERQDVEGVNELKGISYYRKTIHEVTEPLHIQALFGTVDETGADLDQTRFTNSPAMLNQILFGPPGTGKTYNTINKALEALGEELNGLTRSQVKALYDEKVREGQIVFTTFHQSMSYEDFIEGIKPKTENEKVVYEVEEGIFKSICNKARPSAGNFDTVIEEFKNEVSEADGKLPLSINAASTKFKVVYRGTNVFYVQPASTIKVDPWYPANIQMIRKAFETESYDGIYNPTYVREIINYLKQKKGAEKRYW